ncbi:redoxin domain-containing protein [Pedobacter steynii]|uniref:TlpA family protein disulfide reductase n=1 Tax=Pedobacter steynii TaxID=430522 RepID=UPI000944957C|nr:redoxin domain-containing protein [Pedobacter steynii]
MIHKFPDNQNYSPENLEKGLNGKEVSLSDCKVKTIILDFWATWCGPGKKSLPVMQIIVNKYKNAPIVKFLFMQWILSVDLPLKASKSSGLYEYLSLPF